MNGVIPFYQKHGIWFYSVGTLLLWISSSFTDSIWGLLAMAFGAILALSDPAAMLHARFRNGIQLERGLYVAYILGIVATVAFFIRFFMVIPPEKLAAGEEAFLPRLRLALLFIFLLSYIASLLFRFLIALAYTVRAAARTKLHNRRQDYIKQAAYSIVALISVLVLANYLTTLRNPVLDFPGTYTFGDQASTLIGSLDRDIEAYVFLPEAQMVKTKPGPGTEPELIRISEDVRLMLEQLPIINSHIKLTFLNADLASFDSTEFGSVSNGTIIFRVRKSQLTGVDEKPYIERRVYVYSERDLGRLEKEATRALIHVASPQIKVCFTNSNGERFGFTHQANKADGLGELKRELQFFNANIQSLDFNNDWPGPISDDCDAVFITGPSVPFGVEAQNAVFDYLKRGGNVLIAIDPAGREHFDWLRQRTAGPYYAFVDKPLTNTRLSGLAITQDTVEHRITENISSGGRQSILLVKQGYFQKAANPAAPDGAMSSNQGDQVSINDADATDNADHTNQTDNANNPPGKNAIYRTPADLVPEVFLYSNYESYYDANFNGRLDGAEKTVREPIGIAYAQPENPEGPKIVMYSGVDWLTDRGLSFPVYKANQVLLVDSLMWMTENPLAAALVAEEPESETVQLTDEIKLRLLIFGLVLFPLGITITMIVAVVLYRRRRRFVGER